MNYREPHVRLPRLRDNRGFIFSPHPLLARDGAVNSLFLRLIAFLQLCTRLNRAGGIYRASAFDDVRDLSFLINHERRPVREFILVVENPISFRHLSSDVAQQRKRHADLFRKSIVGGLPVNAHAQNCRVIQVDFAAFDTSLVSL